MVKITYECEKCGQDDFDDEEYALAHEEDCNYKSRNRTNMKTY